MYLLQIDPLPEMAFETKDDVFHPTGTSLSLIRAFSEFTNDAGRLLDLGCGCGIVGIMARKLGLASSPVYASDLSPEAVDCARANAQKHGCDLVARSGSLFEPWTGDSFDTILDDVSGVAEEIARISPWFANVPCASGADGADLVCQVIRECPAHLRPRGRLFFPVISLSNGERILKVAGETFKSVTKIAHEEWPLPKEMAPHAALIKRLQQDGKIQITQKFGMIIFSTDIYVAHNDEGRIS